MSFIRHDGRFFALSFCAAIVVVNGSYAMAGELRSTRIFGPETRTGPYKHPACMTELRNGDLYLVYYGGAGEYAVETAVFGSRLKQRRDEVEPIPGRSPTTRSARSATA